MQTKRKQILVAKERKQQFPDNTFYVIKSKGKFYLEVSPAVYKKERIVFKTA